MRFKTILDRLNYYSNITIAIAIVGMLITSFTLRRTTRFIEADVNNAQNVAQNPSIEIVYAGDTVRPNEVITLQLVSPTDLMGVEWTNTATSEILKGSDVQFTVPERIPEITFFATWQVGGSTQQATKTIPISSLP